MAKIQSIIASPNPGFDTGETAANKINEALASVETDSSMEGNGTSGSPLKINGPFTQWRYGSDYISGEFEVGSGFISLNYTAFKGNGAAALMWSTGDIIEARGSIGGYVSFKITYGTTQSNYVNYGIVKGPGEVAFTTGEIVSFSLQASSTAYTSLAQTITEQQLQNGKRYQWGVTASDMTAVLPKFGIIELYVTGADASDDLTILTPNNETIDGASSLVIGSSYNGKVILIAWDWNDDEFKVTQLNSEGGAAFPQWKQKTATAWDGSNYAPNGLESDLQKRTVNDGISTLNFIAPTNFPTDRNEVVIIIDNSANNTAIGVINWTGYVFKVGVRPSGLAANAQATLKLNNEYGVIKANWEVDE